MLPPAAMIGSVIGPAKQKKSITAVSMIAHESAKFFTIESQ